MTVLRVALPAEVAGAAQDLIQGCRSCAGPLRRCGAGLRSCRHRVSRPAPRRLLPVGGGTYVAGGSRRRTAVVQRTHAVVESPIGPLTLVAEDGVLCGLHMDVTGRAPGGDELGGRDDAGFGEVVGQLAEYFAGDRTDFDGAVGHARQRLPAPGVGRVDPDPVRHDVVLQAARRGDRPASGYEMARAVGGANGANPISIIVPCHRVIGADGSLVGYGGGCSASGSCSISRRRPRSAPPGCSDPASVDCEATLRMWSRQARPSWDVACRCSFQPPAGASADRLS